MATKSRKHLLVDLFIIATSVLAAIFLIKSGIIVQILSAAQYAKYIGSFAAGIFFTSVFTTAPAVAAFVEIAQFNSIVIMALLGGLGAVLGDLIIFHFVKDRFAADVKYLLALRGWRRLDFMIFHRRLFRWISVFLGALVIASPLPDEIGIALLGLSKIKNRNFIFLSYILNTLGILIIGLISRAVT